MSASVCRVGKMDVLWSIFKLLLFQTMVMRCSGKQLPVRVEFNDVEDVQDSIRQFLHTGIYSHRDLDPSQVQVVTPVKVSHGGEFVSHDVQHAHDHGHARARRDLHGVEHSLPHMLHYNLTVDGRNLRLDLRPSVTFITPAMVVERHTATGRTRERPHVDATACHYTGSVRGQPASRVAISACDGLAGHLHTESGEYYIEPSTQEPTDKSSGRPHVVFRRSAVDKVEGYHRRKREANSRSNEYNPVGRNNNRERNMNRNPNRNTDFRRKQKEANHRRRLAFLEERHRRLEAMRKDPAAYRRQTKNQTRLRMEQRRKQAARGRPVANRNSLERRQRPNRPQNRARAHQATQREESRRRDKRDKNCATKQPPYHQRKEKYSASFETEELGRYKNNRRNSRWNAKTKRNARSVSKPRHVEVLLVADKTLTDFHTQNKLQIYLLTIMNMVSELYSRPSIGNYIKVVVVKIILVEEMSSGLELNVTSNADDTLASFCSWQNQLNPNNEEDPHHHDVAILVTRQDICSVHDTPCSTLGVAHVGGMCMPDRSCSVNEDNGLSLAHTITHELGHNFGLYHDTASIGCHRREGATLHIMTPIFESDTLQVAWSRCSKRDVTIFLDAGLGDCLSDVPSQEELYVYPKVPAGVTYDAAEQCHLQFGGEAIVCASPDELCQHLWCLVNNTCTTILRPAAPGTMCGENMWCQNQTCVARTASPAPRDGGWGPWSEWSDCSRTCGAGVSTQSRECNNPAPKNNGAYCIGDRSRYKTCNIEPCPINEPTYREVQCSRHNNKNYEILDDKGHKESVTIDEWIPYFEQDKPCELKCVPRNGSLVEDLTFGVVADGTPCRQTLGARDICISGVCYKVGCDWIVGSDKVEDACGVCGGSGSACKTVQGIYNKDTTRVSGDTLVAVIPAGSRNVKVQEKVSPGNFISIRSARNSRKLYLSGTRYNTTMTEYFVAGAPAVYERDRDWEKVHINGPLAEDIKVFQRIFSGSHRNPGVTYQYTVDRPRARFSYRMSEWSACSATCGDGYMQRHYQCFDDHNRQVDLSSCYHMEAPRHEALRQKCRAPDCAAHWWVGPWKLCPPCHMPGEKATRERNVHCVNKVSNKVVDDKHCDLSVKPKSSIICSDVPAC